MVFHVIYTFNSLWFGIKRFTISTQFYSYEKVENIIILSENCIIRTYVAPRLITTKFEYDNVTP